MPDNKPMEVPVIWLQAATCTGCSVSVLNAVSPTVKNVLIDEVIPGKHLNLRYHATIMAGAGDQVIGVLEETATSLKGAYVLVVEGAIPTARDGIYGAIGEKAGKEIPITRWAAELGRNALATIALGTCAAFGGIPAGAPNPTGCMGTRAFYDQQGIVTPVVNVPGCPRHPDWFLGTVAAILINGLPKPEDLDPFGRPKAFYGKLIHENCPRRAYFDEGKFAKKLSDEGCLYELGCKGPVTYADCPIRLWNNGVNWCVGAGSPCFGCVEPTFPDVLSPMYHKITGVEIPKIGEYWQKESTR